MLVFCEECGSRNNIETAALSKETKTAGSLECASCGEALVVTPIQNLQARLVLTFRDQAIEVGKKRPVITLGRGTGNDIVLKGQLVSRTHAVILCRKNRFVLIDESRNGTYVQIRGKKGRTVLRDEEVVLSGEGFLIPGRKPTPDSRDLIKFALLT